MSDASESSLGALVRKAVVRISAAHDGYPEQDDQYWGSGFFIAPGWLVTSAHVLAKGGGAVWLKEQVIGVSWPGGTARGELALTLPPLADPQAPPRSWPLPDIALVRVPEAAGHECVWLSDIPTATGLDVGLHGWSTWMGSLGYRQVRAESEGIDGGAVLVRGERPVPGCSGGPVVDRARGTAVALIKAFYEEDPTAGVVSPLIGLGALLDLPGGEIYHDVLRAHDRYHLRRHLSPDADDSWTDVQAGLRPEQPGSFGPVLRTNLYGRLAELPPPANPGEVMALVDHVKDEVFRGRYRSGFDHTPRSWREGAGLLYDLRDTGPADRSLELEAVVLYAAAVCAAVARRGRAQDEAALRELSGWVRQTGQPLTRFVRMRVERILCDADGGQTPSAARADVLVEVERGNYGDRYPWRVKLVQDGRLVTPLHGDEEGVSRAALAQALRAPLADALRKCDVGDYLAKVEIALPPELFDEPVDSWELGVRRAPDDRSDPEGLPLGERRVVVVRDRRRLGTGTPEWRKRWTGVERGPLAAVPLRQEARDQDGHGHRGGGSRDWRKVYDRLSQAPWQTVPVYCGPVATGEGAVAIDAALAAGHPIAIWRRCAAGHTDCAEFHHQMERLVAQAGRAEGLHERIRSLRIRAGGPAPADPEIAWSRSIVLLYDPPDHPPVADQPLCEPVLGPSLLS